MDIDEVRELLLLRDSASDMLMDALLEIYFELDYEIQILLDDYLRSTPNG